MPNEMSPLVFVIALVVTALVCVPYAAIGKYLMGALFGRKVWFGLVLLTTIVSVTIASMSEFLYGFGAWVTLDDAFTINGLQEVAACFLLQIAVYFAFVPDVHIRWIAPWNWFVVVAIQYAVSLVIIYTTLYFIEPGKFAGFFGTT